MEKRTGSPYPRIDRPILAVIGLVVVISTIQFARNDREREWRYYQNEFRSMVRERFGEEKAASIPPG